MKKNKLLVIFFLSCIFSYIIYNYTINNRIDILVLGDNYLLNSEYETYDKYLLDKYYNLNNFNKVFTSENITYKEIINKIKNNYYIYSKDKKIYINPLIANADIIIVNANNDKYFEKCNKSESIILKYDEDVSNDINELKNLIKKISPAKVVVISNYCYNQNYNINNGDINLNQIYYKYQNSKSKRLNDKVNYQIYNKIVEYIS